VKTLKLRSVLLSLMVTLIISISSIQTTKAQLTTNNGYLNFQNSNQSLYGNNGASLVFRANHSTVTQQMFHNNMNVRFGGIKGAENIYGKYFGLVDADGDWSIAAKTDGVTSFRINSIEKMALLSNGQLELKSTRDATGTPNSGVLEIGNALRIDNNEIITNTDAALYLNNDNNGDVVISGSTFRVDASEDCVRIGNVLPVQDKYKLFVEKGILTEEVRVSKAADWADDVFESNYDLNSIEEVETFVKENNHLPNVPSKKEVNENGVSMVEMDATLLRQIEELWLHIIELKKENDALQVELKALKK